MALNIAEVEREAFAAALTGNPIPSDLTDVLEAHIEWNGSPDVEGDPKNKAEKAKVEEFLADPKHPEILC